METYQHLRIEREQPVNPKRPGTSPRVKVPEDLSTHGRGLYESFKYAKELARQDIGGFDDRCLFKLQIETLSPDALENIPGVELVSQETGGYALAFANQQGLEVFESRLSMLMRGEAPTRKEIFLMAAGTGRIIGASCTDLTKARKRLFRKWIGLVSAIGRTGK